ncbi:unnamed protein product [Calypogeia fissa]
MTMFFYNRGPSISTVRVDNLMLQFNSQQQPSAMFSKTSLCCSLLVLIMVIQRRITRVDKGSRESLEPSTVNHVDGLSNCSIQP